MVRVDNTSKQRMVDPTPGTVVQASAFAYEEGQDLLVVHGGRLLDARVTGGPAAGSGSLHRVRLSGDAAEVELDLNEMNHCPQRCGSAESFEAARAAYCRQLVEDGRFIEDAITSNRLSVTEQLVRLTMETHDSAARDAGAIAHMSFDDLEWVAGTDISVQDRVWALGSEGFVEHRERSGRCIVKLADGSSTPPLAANLLKKARPIAGVQDASFAAVRDVSGLVPLLTRPNARRPQGAHCRQPVLVCAGPGTGKSWSMQQLQFLLAQELSAPRAQPCEDPVRLVPLLIPIQKLARMLRDRQAATSPEPEPGGADLVLFYIRREFTDAPTRAMLTQAFDMRALVVMLDGVDEAANLKQAVEEFVTKTLVPMGMPLVLTSRPEGVRKRLYARDFVIMHLQPLSGDEQHQIARKQLQGNELFERILACSGLRQRAMSGCEEAKALLEGQKDLLRPLLKLSDCEADFDAALEARLQVFGEVVEVPVLLSVLVCVLGAGTGELPRDAFELYDLGVRAALRRHFAGGEEQRAGPCLEMLQAIAAANHLAKRRTFQPGDVRRALADRPDLQGLWSELVDRGEVPVVKILTLGDTGEFQFRHLSFQECLFVRELCGRGLAEGGPAQGAAAFWGGAEGLSGRLNDAFYRNAFVLGRGHLGRALSARRAEWDFDCQPRLSALGTAALRGLLAGAAGLRLLDLSNLGLGAPDE
ncbi:unnamed protein product, partial [Prorocentrum cordatum]